jgi:peptide/nickel transport system substrate-binding protein
MVLVRMALALGLALAAWGAQAQELRIGIGAEPTQVDPHAQDLGPNNEVRMHLFDSLVAFGPDMELLPGLATSWRVTENPLIWEFRLRQNVRFHDGAPFTARDAAFSLERAKDVPGAPSTYSRYLREIESTELVDDHTLLIRTRGPTPLLPNNLVPIAIVSERAARNSTPANFATGIAAVGTGPYRFVAFVPGQHMIVAANPEYWGGAPRWQRVTIRPFRSAATRLAALLTGEVDAIAEVPTADAARVSQDQRFAVASGVSNRVVFWAMDVARENSPHVTARGGGPIRNPFRDARVREAVALAIDRRIMVDRVMEGLAVAAHQITVDGMSGFDPALRMPDVDVTRARALMASAGHADGFRLALHTTSGRYVNDVRIAQAVAQMLARLNIEASVLQLPAAMYFQQAREQAFSFLLVSWGHATGDSYVVLRETFQSASLNNYGRWVNAEADRLIAAAETEMDLARRSALMAEVSRIAAREWVTVPTHYQVNLWAMRRGLAYAPRRDELTVATGFAPN